MLETNIRLFKDGTQLSLQVRRVKVDSWQEGATFLQQVCNAFHSRGLAAVPGSIEGKNYVLVASLSEINLKDSIGNRVSLI